MVVATVAGLGLKEAPKAPMDFGTGQINFFQSFDRALRLPVPEEFLHWIYFSLKFAG